MENNYSHSIYFKLFTIFIVCGITIFLSCRKFESNPYQSDKTNIPSNLNAKNIEKLLSSDSTSDDTVTIIFTADSQRYYDQLDSLVQTVNKYNNIDFLLLDGDISDFGLLQEFLRINERLVKLHIPYICTVGNHDLNANGSEIYTRMFGPKNFTFTYKKYKFLCHDDNSHEYNYPGNVPDLNWLSKELNDSSAKWFVGVSHVPPWSSDFDQKIVHDYMNLFGSKPGFILSLHGHEHIAEEPVYFNNDSVLYMNSNGIQNEKCYLLKLINGSIIIQMIQY